jgi:RNA polymerase sigma-70 factor (ECF subfamily)
MSKTQNHSCNPSDWVEVYSNEFFKFAVYRTSNHQVAEDLVQDTFLSGLKALKKFRGDCSEKSWLYNILRNKIIDHYRKKTNQEIKKSNSFENSDDDTFFQQFFKSEGANSGHWNSNSSPLEWDIAADSYIEQKEFLQILQICLSALPELWSKVFSLKNIDDYSTKEICKELNITSSNQWTIIHRAKLQLRACLEKKWLDK